MPEKILVVEDSVAMRRSLVRLLEWETYEVATAEDGAAGLAAFAKFSPDLIIMDINMPRLDGLQAIKRLREVSNVPVLVLSVRASESDRVIGLDTGADDYLGKPFGADELLARVRALLRRRPTVTVAEPSSGVLRLGGGELVIDLTMSRVVLRGALVHLTPIEASLLFALAERPGEVLSHTELMTRTWGNSKEGTRENLKLYILYLRRKVEPAPDQPRYVITERGHGYRLAAL